MHHHADHDFDSALARDDERPVAAPRAPLAPGKVTATMRLAPRPTAPVQHKRAPGAGGSPTPSPAPASSPPASRLDDWTRIAFRPDLHDDMPDDLHVDEPADLHVDRPADPDRAPTPAPVQRKGIAPAPGVPNAASISTASGRPLPGPVQAKMERAFGADFSPVRVHEDDSAPAMGALAYTRGADIHFAPGRYDPGTQTGQELLGHELAHVVQQSHGRVPVPAQAKGAAINADPALEREADDLGARAARGEVVAGGGAIQHHHDHPRDSAIQHLRDSAIQQKLNYDKTWAALNGYGAWHEGRGELWTQVSQAYDNAFLTLVAWLDGDGADKLALLAQLEPDDHPLRADLATADGFRQYDDTNISVQTGESIRDTLIPILSSNVRKRVGDWYAGQLRQQRDEVTRLARRLRDNTDPSTVHGGLNLLADREGFQPYRDTRGHITEALNELGALTSPDDIARELADDTRDGNRTYQQWIEAVIVAYGAAKDEILQARARNRLDKETRQKENQEREEQEREREQRELDAYDRATQTIQSWAGNSSVVLQQLYSREQLLTLAGELNAKDAGRVANITGSVPDLHANQDRLIELLIANKDNIIAMNAVMQRGACAFALLAAGVSVADAGTALALDGAAEFIDLYGEPAVTLIEAKTHAAPLAAFGVLRGKGYIQQAWLAGHLTRLVALNTKIANTPGVDHFLRTYAKAGLDALATAAATDRGMVDLSRLRETLQAGQGVSYFRYDPDDTTNLEGNGGDTRVAFARDSAQELEAFDDTHDRTDKGLTRAEKLRFMGKTEDDTKSFSTSDWEEYRQLETWDDLEVDQKDKLKREDTKALRKLKVKATMQLVKRDGEVIDRDLQVFVSGGEHSSGYGYKVGQKNKTTGQKHPNAPLGGLTYDVTGQSSDDYQHVGHDHIGHHDGSREFDAEVKIVSQTVAALTEHAQDHELDGATLRIFVDRYTCPNCSDLLYKAKTNNQLLAVLAAIEVIYTGART